jgi:hypothetical protein
MPLRANFAPMPPPLKPKPENLDDLMARAEHYAEFAMRKIGHLPPTLFLLGAHGPMMFIPDNLKDEHAKDDFATTARLMCVAHAAAAAVMALEAWATVATPEEPLDATTPPSEAYNRRECVVLMGEGPGGQKQKFLPIIRTDAGGFFGFGEFEMPELDSMQGRFAQILPPRPPEEKDRALALALLAAKGVGPAGSTATQSCWKSAAKPSRP